MEEDSPTDIKTLKQKSNPLIQSFKHEWSLFWASFTGEEEAPKIKDKTVFEAEVSKLSKDGLTELVKKLSTYKKNMNHRIEDIQAEIDESTQRIESVLLVGGEIEDIQEEIENLKDEGFNLTEEIQKIDVKLKVIRATLEEGISRF